MTAGEGFQPGWCVGRDSFPDEFTLVEYRTSGMEGQLWRARRIDDRGRVRGADWAVKVLWPGDPKVRKAAAEAGDDPAGILRKWEERWYRSQLDATTVARVPGVVVPRDTFLGPAPHPAGYRRADRALYTISDWVDGPDLSEWRASADPSRIPWLLEDLGRIVDGLHGLGHIHGDISSRNVMVDRNGAVRLIDLTFMRHVDVTRTVVGSPGYAAPEQVTFSTMARDVHAVGAVAFFLLTGIAPPDAQIHERIRRVLAVRGWPPELVNHLTAALHPDPSQRPQVLRPWARELGSLVERHGLGPRCVDLVTDPRDVPVGVTGSLLSLSTTLAELPGGLSSVEGVGASADGTGRPVVFAVDSQRSLRLATNRHTGWDQVTTDLLQVGPRIAVIPDNDGSVLCFSGGPDGVLRHRLPPGDLNCAEERFPRPSASHASGMCSVEAAGITPDGRATIIVGIGDESWALLLHPQGHDWEPLPRRAITAAAVGLSRWDNPEVFLSSPDGLVSVEKLRVGWSPPTPIHCPYDVSAVAVASHRAGHILAVGGKDGVHVTTPTGWTTLLPTPAIRVVLRPSRGWQYRLAAIAGSRPHYWQEEPDHAWRPLSLRSP